MRQHRHERRRRHRWRIYMNVSSSSHKRVKTSPTSPPPPTTTLVGRAVKQKLVLFFPDADFRKRRRQKSRISFARLSQLDIERRTSAAEEKEKISFKLKKNFKQKKISSRLFRSTSFSMWSIKNELELVLDRRHHRQRRRRQRQPGLILQPREIRLPSPNTSGASATASELWLQHLRFPLRPMAPEAPGVRGVEAQLQPPKAGLRQRQSSWLRSVLARMRGLILGWGLSARWKVFPGVNELNMVD